MGEGRVRGDGSAPGGHCDGRRSPVTSAASQLVPEQELRPARRAGPGTSAAGMELRHGYTLDSLTRMAHFAAHQPGRPDGPRRAR